MNGVDVVICQPMRTAIGAFGGAFKDTPAVTLAATVIREVLSRSGLGPEDVDDVVLGNVLPAGQGMNPARQAAVEAGLGIEVPAYVVQRVCGSGLQAVISAAQAIRAGDAHVVVAGGMENMNQAPFLLKKARYGYRLAMPSAELLDGMVSDGLWDSFSDVHMGMTAENVAAKYGITREEQDAFALASQTKAARAAEAGAFADQIVGVPVQSGKETVTVTKDEHPRPDTTLEKLAKLKPAFKKDGTVTAGNSSGINDGAAAMIVADARKALDRGVKPWARLRSHAVCGVEPALMGLGPVPAVREALERADLSLDDIDLFEVNEAFAAQSLGVLRELPIPPERLNVNGGAIALGHPIGATGAVLVVKLLHELKRRDARLGLVSLCIGGGMGIAAVLEAC